MVGNVGMVRIKLALQISGVTRRAMVLSDGPTAAESVRPGGS